MSVWAVCGPPRSATTFMLEAIAVWTDLSVCWRMDSEWMSRIGEARRFYEGPCEMLPYHAVVKVLDPEYLRRLNPERAVLMVRNDEETVASCRKNGMNLSVEQVRERRSEFARFDRVDCVGVGELADLDALFARLGRKGWPVRKPEMTMVTKALR